MSVCADTTSLVATTKGLLASVPKKRGFELACPLSLLPDGRLLCVFRPPRFAPIEVVVVVDGQSIHLDFLIPSHSVVVADHHHPGEETAHFIPPTPRPRPLAAAATAAAAEKTGGAWG